MSYPVILPAVVLEPTTTIYMTEVTPQTLTIIDPALGTALTTSKTFYLRGDGSNDDLLRAIKLTLDSHASANTYSVTIARSMDGAALPGVVTISRLTGPNNFSIDWFASLTTFDERLLGFRNITTSSGTSATGDMSPTAQWVSNEIIEEFEPEDEVDGFVQRARSGLVIGGLRGGPYDVRRMSMRFLTAERTNASSAPTISGVRDTGRSLSTMWATLATGKRFELHFPDVSAGVALGALSSATRQAPNNSNGTTWHIDSDTVEGGFRPERLSPGVPLYSARMRLLGGLS